MNRQLGFASGIWVTLVVASWISVGSGSVHAQESKFTQSANQPVAEPPRSQSVLPPDNISNQAMVNEINAIRSQLGGGIAEQFKGLKLNGSDGENLWKNQLNREFSQELTRLANESQSGSIMPTPETPAGDNRQPQWIQRPPPNEISSSNSRVEKLRSAARRMDEITAELEEANMFQEADQIREQARKLWLKARQQWIIKNTP